MLLGIYFLILGIFDGSTILQLLELIPFPALRVPLGYIGIQHTLLVKELSGWYVWITVVSVSQSAYLISNLAIGFGVSAGIYFGFRDILALQKRWNSQREIIGR